MNFSERPAVSLVLFCLGLGLLFSIGLMSRSIWFDEAITLQSLAETAFTGMAPGAYQVAELKPFVTGNTTIPRLIEHYIATDVHPPLYFLVAHGFGLAFGTSLIAARMVSLLLVLGSVALLARTLHRIGQPGAWLQTLIYGLSFAAASTAQDARGYGMILLLAVLAWRLLTTIPEHTGQKRLSLEIGLGLACGGLLLTHYFAVLLVFSFFAWHLIDALRRRTAVALVAPVVCTSVFLPWLPILFDHLTARPGAFAGFQGVVEWLKRAVLQSSGQVLSATHYAIPDAVQKWGRAAIALLILIGSAAILLRPGRTDAQVRFYRIALFVPILGLLLFLTVSMVMDRWFDTFRYFIFYAPFLTILAARGVMILGEGCASVGPAILRYAPAAALVATQLAMLNWGYESNRNRGGAYFDTLAQHVSDGDPSDSLVLIDVGTGRGTLLAAAYALPASAQVFLLPQDATDWATAAKDIALRLDQLTQVLLVFTIERGEMGSDKASLYGPIVTTLADLGFVRVSAPPDDQGGRYYARWTRTPE